MREERQYDSKNGVVNAVKREILGNTYLVVVYPSSDAMVTARVYVYCNKRTGEDFDFPDRRYNLGKNMDDIIKRDVRHNERLSSVTALALDDAVEKVEEYQEENMSTQDEVIGGIETIAEDRGENT